MSLRRSQPRRLSWTTFWAASCLEWVELKKRQPNIPKHRVFRPSRLAHLATRLILAAASKEVTDRRYAVFQIGSEDKHKVIVRTKNHGDLQSKKVVTYSVKPEYLPQIGAEVGRLELGISPSFSLENPC